MSLIIYTHIAGSVTNAPQLKYGEGKSWTNSIIKYKFARQCNAKMWGCEKSGSMVSFETFMKEEYGMSELLLPGQQKFSSLFLKMVLVWLLSIIDLLRCLHFWHMHNDWQAEVSNSRKIKTLFSSIRFVLKSCQTLAVPLAVLIEDYLDLL